MGFKPKLILSSVFVLIVLVRSLSDVQPQKQQERLLGFIKFRDLGQLEHKI